MLERTVLDEELKPHRILREVFRNFRQFKELVSRQGIDVIDYSYAVREADGSKGIRTITISYSDLLGQLNKLSDRKREAVFYNVIMDMKQKDVADIMDITTVSVGQYVDTAMEQLADKYFIKEKPDDQKEM